MSIFASLDVYRDIDSRGGAMNMAIDEALLETAVQPTIRFYQWDHPALSFGYFGKFEDVANQDRDVVRRWTGGGIVFHGEDLTYSIVIPAGDRALGEASMSIYEKTHHAIRAALAANGYVSELAASAGPKISESCFANPVRADVLSNGHKVAGAAQRRTRRGLLQQGSIQNVNFGNGFADLFVKALCGDSRPKQLNTVLLAHAEAIAAQKYSTPTWLHRR
jgi:lipoate-protein ligase A